MRVALCLAVLSLAVAAQAASLHSDVPQQWLAFKMEHNKLYEAGEEDLRMKVFVDNKRKIDEHNQLFKQGKSSFTMKMNRFGDLLQHEFAEMMNTYSRDIVRKTKGTPFVRPNPAIRVAASVDWRESGYVTEVKDQAQCGSCYAFSATGSLEGQHFHKTGKLVSLSEQNIVDCSRSYGNNGCGGGLMDFVFSYIKDNGGIDTEASYPYEGVNRRCRYDPANSGATVTGYVDVDAYNEDALKDAVATVGPVSVAIDASRSSFQFYSSGVYDEPSCSQYFLDHGVLAAGYGTENGQDYWLVKNSWGASWGMDGYINMSRNKNNQCGIATEPSYPTV